MKIKILAFFTIMLLTSTLRAQSTEYSILDIRSYEQEIDRIKDISPGRYEIINKYSQTEIVLIKTDPHKPASEVLEKVPLRKKGEYISVQDFLELNEHQKINPFVIGLFPGTNIKSYQLADSGFTLVIPSQKQLLNQ